MHTPKTKLTITIHSLTNDNRIFHLISLTWYWHLDRCSCLSLSRGTQPLRIRVKAITKSARISSSELKSMLTLACPGGDCDTVYIEPAAHVHYENPVCTQTHRGNKLAHCVAGKRFCSVWPFAGVASDFLSAANIFFYLTFNQIDFLSFCRLAERFVSETK